MKKTPRLMPPLTENDLATLRSTTLTNSFLGCEEWMGPTVNSGYGIIRLENGGSRPFLAHRVAFVAAYGPLPEGKPFVCHACDNTLCCNPAHLFPGNNRDNALDASAKGRMNNGDRHGLRKHPERRPRGEKHGLAVLSDELVRQIFSLFNGGMRGNAVARHLGLQPGPVFAALRGDNWGHVGCVRTRPLTKALPGEANSHATIKDDDVRTIRRRIRDGATCREIASEVGCTPKVVMHIRSGKTWRHVE